MREPEIQLGLLRDPRIAPLVLSPLPMWLWRPDGSGIVFANPIGAAIFGSPNAATVATRMFDSGQPAAAQIAELAPTLTDAPIVVKLRAFGAGIGRTLACNCSLIALPNGRAAVLVVATERAGPEFKLAERVQHLVAALPEPVAVFTTDGRLIYAPPDSLARIAHAPTISAISADTLANEAVALGHASGQTSAGLAAIDVIGSGADTVLLMTFPAAPAREAVPPSAPEIVAPPVETQIVAPPVAPEPTRIEPTHIEPTPAPQPAPVVTAPPVVPPVTPAEVPLSHIPLPDFTFDRRHPLRFVWQMDAEGHFTLGSDEFTALIGPRVAGALGRLWTDVAADLGLDPDGQVAHAIATQNTWSGIVVQWPVDGSNERLAVELSGLPVFDRDRTFRGYRGFGVCRDTDRLASLANTRRFGMTTTAAPQAPSLNVVPFRGTTPAQTPPATEPKAPAALSPVEHSAFRELARQLSDRLHDTNREEDQAPDEAAPDMAAPDMAARDTTSDSIMAEIAQPAANRERPILDRVPVGVLVYRHNDLIYANRAFLEWTGYDDLAALSEAGGLDALFIEPGVGETDDGGQTLTLSNNDGAKVPVQGRLFTVPWQGENALALILVPSANDDRAEASEAALAAAEATARDLTAQADQAQAQVRDLTADIEAAQTQARNLDTNLEAARTEANELLSAIDTTSDAVLALDRDGRILWANAGARKLFGSESRPGNALHELLAPEGARLARDEIERLAQGGTKALNEAREVGARAADGNAVSLTMIIGRISDDAQKFCVVLRDITSWKKTAAELIEAKREADKASAAKSAFLAKISHEIRTPLNAIIGFSEVMMTERFGPVGNDRYRAYLKDIHASGGHLVSLLNDLLDLSKIEAGKMELHFTDVGLNDLMQQCVAIMQPQANKERIIIRTSLAQRIPHIVADARSVRQIVLNLLSNSIKFTGAGGQVIVSSALNDNGQVVLRVRDTGAGMSEEDIATALEPFRQLATSARWGSGGTGLGLPLTKALAEANHASFSIKSQVNEGTLVEVAFPPSRLPAAE